MMYHAGLDLALETTALCVVDITPDCGIMRLGRPLHAGTTNNSLSMKSECH